MMLAYVAVPARLAGIKSDRSRRDKLGATAVGGAIGALVCSPPYAIGRVAIILLGSHTFRVLAVFMLIVAVVLQTGATTATKAIKFSAKLITGDEPADEPSPTGGGPAHDRAWPCPRSLCPPTRSDSLSQPGCRPLGAGFGLVTQRSLISTVRVVPDQGPRRTCDSSADPRRLV